MIELPELPSFLNRTPEQIEAERQRQQILRDLHLKGTRQTPAEQRIGLAMRAERNIRANLELIDVNTDVFRETQLQLAEALADQGKFQEAAKMAQSGEYFEQYKKFAEAVTRDDSETCDCVPDTVQTRNARGGAVAQEIPANFVAAEAFSEKHGRIMPLVQCAKCGDLNVKDAPIATLDFASIEANRDPRFELGNNVEKT